MKAALGEVEAKYGSVALREWDGDISLFDDAAVVLEPLVHMEKITRGE
jgi:hypothetical protein